MVLNLFFGRRHTFWDDPSSIKTIEKLLSFETILRNTRRNSRHICVSWHHGWEPLVFSNQFIKRFLFKKNCIFFVSAGISVQCLDRRRLIFWWQRRKVEFFSSETAQQFREITYYVSGKRGVTKLLTPSVLLSSRAKLFYVAAKYKWLQSLFTELKIYSLGVH